ALEKVPFEKRSARFMCCLVFIDEDGSETTAEGTIEGRIGFEARGEEGFGYDPLFLAEEYDFKVTTAEISQVEKNKISHRGNALRNLRKKLLAK
ncbi:MAG: non-canonical purine NTP pyrophosphatase, partial [Anaerotardibacter sp.]